MSELARLCRWLSVAYKGERTRAPMAERKLRLDPIPTRSKLNKMLSQRSGEIIPSFAYVFTVGV